MKKYFLLSGLNFKDNNRGTAALGYGAFSFLVEKGLLCYQQELLDFQFVRYPWQLRPDKVAKLKIQDQEWTTRTKFVLSINNRLHRKRGIIIPFSRYYWILKNIAFVAAINGGDGLSDIYNRDTFLYRLPDTYKAMSAKIPVIQLPQTIGPFQDKDNYAIVEKVLKYSSKVFVRDNKFLKELESMGIEYEQTKDLSAYMYPEKWNIDIIPDSIGLNVSGLCYSNTFRTLSGQFENYPELIHQLINHFTQKGKHVYLIPHSYCYGNPEPSNDDIVACKAAYERLEDKSNVTCVDYDMTPPQIKYVISQMSFFMGSRMHANFAAIYTGVPLFGLAYSYKFEGAFNSNGLDGEKQTYMINKITLDEIPRVIDKIETFYQTTLK